MPSLTTAMMIAKSREADMRAVKAMGELPSYGRFSMMTVDQLINETKRIAAQIDAHYHIMTSQEKDGMLTHLDNVSWAALMQALAGNADWQLAIDGTMATVLHCTGCGHEIRFGEDDLSTSGGRVRAAEFLQARGECEGRDDFEKAEWLSDQRYDYPSESDAQRMRRYSDCATERAT